MASIINAATSGGLISTADTSGILQLQTASTTAVTVDASQNVGIGVTLSNWSTAYANIFQTKGGSLFGDPTSSEGNFGVNTYYNAGYKYAANGYASVYQQYNSQHIWKIAASGTAGNAITFTSAMTLDASGNLGIGTSSPAEKLHISNGASTCQIRIAGQSRNMYLGQDATGAIVYSDGAVPMVFYTNATEKARITSGGTFLVGSTTVVGSGTEIAGFKGTRGISSQSTGGAGLCSSGPFLIGGTRSTRSPARSGSASALRARCGG